MRTPDASTPRNLHVLWVNEHPRFTGGAEKYVHETAARLAALGLRSSLLYDVAGPTDPRYLRPFESAFPIVDLERQVREIGPDVVYIHRLAGAVRVRALARAGRPALRFFHDHRPFCLREHKYTALTQSPCTRTLGPACYACLGFVQRDGGGALRLRTLGPLRDELQESRALAGAVVASRYMAEHVVRHGFDAERVHVLPLFSEPPRLQSQPPREANRVLFVGQLVTGKGLDVLFEALGRLPATVRLVLAGRGRQEPWLRRRAARLGLEEQVTFLGDCGPADLEREYARASVLALPSRSPETFGLVGPEAMRFGTPVVATRVGGLGAWLEDGVTGLVVPPNDPAALAAALGRMLAERALAERLGLAARRRYAESFLPEKHVERLVALLEEVAA